MRTESQWIEVCKNITAGYLPDGKKELTYTTGIQLAAWLKKYGVWKAGDTIVDVGCGNGRLAMGLVGQSVTYIGVDIIKPCIDFCKDAFAGYPEFTFLHSDTQNKRYWNRGTISPLGVRYPVESDFADVVVAGSLFSHTATVPIAKHIYSELYRIAKPGGLVYSSWLFGEPVEDERKTFYRKADVEELFTGKVKEIVDAEFYGAQVGILCRKEASWTT